MNFAIFILLLVSSYGKVYKKASFFTEKSKFVYIGSFGALEGTSNYALRTKLVLTGEAELTYDSVKLFLVEGWNPLEAHSTCSSLSSRALTVDNIEMGMIGKWNENAKGSFYSAAGPSTYSFVLGICDTVLSEKAKIRYSLHVDHEDGSHLPLESMHLKLIYLLLGLLFGLSLARNLKEIYRLFYYEDTLHLVLVWTSLCLLLQLLSIGLLWGHLISYEKNGMGSRIMEFLGEALGNLSHFLLTYLFVLIGQGWKVKFKYLSNISTHLSFISVLGITNFVLSNLSRINDTSADHFEFLGYSDIGSMCLRFCMFLWFLNSATSHKHTGTSEFKAFLRLLKQVGVFYFISRFSFLALSLLLNYYSRMALVIGGSLLVQGIVLTWISQETLSKESAYSAANQLSEGTNATSDKLHSN